MDMEKIDRYNRSQAAKYDWNPTWFDCLDFGDQLTFAIIEFQKSLGLTADGMCGPSTYRRKWTERESSGDYNVEKVIPSGVKYIVHNGNPYVIHWDKVILWNEEGGLSAKKGTYGNRAGKSERNVNLMVLHWDVCLSSKSCASILSKRGLSCTYLIDNDSTIYVCMDSQHVPYCNGRGFNGQGVGVEISNAYYVDKYQSWYVRNGFGERPVITDGHVHGRSMSPFLGFYPEQLEACAALIEAVSRAMDIPLIIPDTEYAVDSKASSGDWSGTCAHYHLTRNKIDIAGHSMRAIMDRAIQIREENS